MKCPHCGEVIPREHIQEQGRLNMRKLTDKQRRRITLYWVEGLTCIQIAIIEGVSEEAVRQSINQAKNNIKT